jgi:tetratricopeptide (TPR) repeat protein
MQLKYLMKLSHLLLSTTVLLSCGSALFAQDEANFQTGIDLYRAGDFAAAVEKLEPLLKNGKLGLDGARYLAGAYIHLNRTDDATKLFKKSEKLSRRKNEIKYDRELKITKQFLPNFDRSAIPDTFSSFSIRIAVEFKADGTIGFVHPFVATWKGVLPEAIKGVKAIRFEPAVVDGKPVTIVGQWDYNYN